MHIKLNRRIQNKYCLPVVLIHQYHLSFLFCLVYRVVLVVLQLKQMKNIIIGSLYICTSTEFFRSIFSLLFAFYLYFAPFAVTINYISLVFVAILFAQNNKFERKLYFFMLLLLL